MAEAKFDYCWICGGKFAAPFPTGADSVAVDCECCGPYQISMSKYFSHFPLPDSERYRLSHWNKQRQLEGREQVRIDSATIDGILAGLPNPPTHAKPNILLLSLMRWNPTPARYFKIDSYRQYSLACARNLEELDYYLDALIETGYLTRGAHGYSITPRGWHAGANLLNQPEASKIAFVAIRFSEDMLALWDAAFAPAIASAGFEPHLANDPAHNEQIDARIVTELKQCRFVVADVTWRVPTCTSKRAMPSGLGDK